MTGGEVAAEHAPPPLWRNRDFQLLFAGSLTSVVGSEIAAIAYPLLVLAVTGSPAQAGLVAFAETAAAVLVGLPAGALVDRWNKRAVMVTTDGLRLVAAGSIPLALAADRLTLAQIVAVAAVTGAAGSFFYPARMVAVRRTVPPDQLPAALSQNQARVAIGSLVGPSV
ncbi:MAG TPA: MFS transporter, partial [Mycobacteriales bacterium]